MVTEIEAKKGEVPKFQYVRRDEGYTVEHAFGICYACGGFGPYSFKEIIEPKLAKDWGLSKIEKKAFSSRESMYCAFCGCSARLRNLALAITLVLDQVKDKRVLSLEEAINQNVFKREMKIAEINSCGQLHEILKNINNLYYSEYMPTDETRHEDLEKLTYDNNMFDMVLTSDTLEHVPDPVTALSEIFRVLKPGGVHIFTVPMIYNRKTKNRVSRTNKTTKYNYTKSYHGSGEPDYLVWNEFGGDIYDTLTSIGYETTIFFHNMDNPDDPSHVLIAKKPDNKHSKWQSLNRISDPTEKYIEDGNLIQIQVAKVQRLADKIQLTNNHAENLSEINNAQAKYIKKLEGDFNKLSRENENLKKQFVYRIKQGARSLAKKARN